MNGKSGDHIRDFRCIYIWDDRCFGGKFMGYGIFRSDKMG